LISLSTQSGNVWKHPCMWKEAVLILLQALQLNVPGKNEKIHKKPLARWPVFRSKFKSRSSRTRCRNDNQHTSTVSTYVVPELN